MNLQALQLFFIAFVFVQLITSSSEQNSNQSQIDNNTNVAPLKKDMRCENSCKRYQHAFKGIDIITNDAFVPPYSQIDLKSDIFRCEHIQNNWFSISDKIYNLPDNVNKAVTGTVMTCQRKSDELDIDNETKTHHLQNVKINTDLRRNYADIFDSDSFGYFSNSKKQINSLAETTTFQAIGQYIHVSIRSNLGSTNFLSKEFSNAIASLKYPFSEHSQSYQDIIDQYGTHYATHITYGGQIVIKRQYKSILDMLTRNKNNSFSILDVLGGINKLGQTESAIINSCGASEWVSTIVDKPAVLSIQVEPIEMLIENTTIRGEFRKAFDFYRYTAYLQNLRRDFSNIFDFTENHNSCEYFAKQNVTYKLIKETSNLLENRTSNLQDIKQKLSVLSDILTTHENLIQAQQLYLEVSKFYHCKIPRLCIDINYCNPSYELRNELRLIREYSEAFIKQYNTTEFGNFKTTEWNKEESNLYLESTKYILSTMFRFQNTIETAQFVKCRDHDEASLIRSIVNANSLNNCHYPKNCPIVKNS